MELASAPVAVMRREDKLASMLEADDIWLLATEETLDPTEAPDDKMDEIMLLPDAVAEL